MSGNSGYQQEQMKFRYAVFLTMSFVGLLWFVKVLEYLGGTSFAHFGILPRTLRGVIGIFTGPLIHGDFVHLISNTLPFIVLGILLFYFYYKIAIEVFLWIYIMTGFWIWLLARHSYHIGASGVIYGMAAFLFFSGIFKRNTQLMTISGVIIILYGGMLYGIFPDFVEADVSWEAHLMGAVVGTIIAFWFRKTKIDIEQSKPEDPEHEQDGDNQDYFRTPTVSDDINAIYSYKPRKG